jgi:hypothetical protein
MDMSNRLRNYIKDTVPKDVLDYFPKEVFCLDLFDLLTFEDDKYILDLFYSNKLDTYEMTYLLVSAINLRDKYNAINIYSQILEDNNQALRAVALECLYKLQNKLGAETIKFIAAQDKDETIREIAEYFLNN